MGTKITRPKRCIFCGKLIRSWNKSLMCAPCYTAKALALKKQRNFHLGLRNRIYVHSVGIHSPRKSTLKQFCVVCGCELPKPHKSMHCDKLVCKKTYWARKDTHRWDRENGEYHRQWYQRNKARIKREYALSRKNYNTKSKCLYNQ